MTAYQLDELHLTLAQMEVSDRARLAQAAGVNLSTVQKFAMSREHGVPSRKVLEKIVAALQEGADG